jgi:hypothetical protein
MIQIPGYLRGIAGIFIGSNHLTAKADGTTCTLEKWLAVFTQAKLDINAYKSTLWAR